MAPHLIKSTLNVASKTQHPCDSQLVEAQARCVYIVSVSITTRAPQLVYKSWGTVFIGERVIALAEVQTFTPDKKHHKSHWLPRST